MNKVLDSFKNEIEKLAKSEDRKNVLKDLAAGASAGLAASYATYPIDTISNRKQMHPGLTIPDITKGYYEEGKQLATKGKLFAGKSGNILSRFMQRHPRIGGASHFYGGAGVKVFKVAPYTAISFALYEALKKKMHANDQKDTV
jgi:hypothetical protein